MNLMETFLLTRVLLHPACPMSPWCPLLSQDPDQDPCDVQTSRLLRLLWALAVLRLSLLLMLLTALRRTGVRDFPPWEFDVFLMVTLGRWVWGGGEGPSHPSSWGDCRQPDSSLLVLTWVPGLKSCWSGVSTVESRLPSSHAVPFGRRSLCPADT